MKFRSTGWLLIVIGTLALSGSFLGGCATLGRPTHSEHDDVVAVVNRLFEGMRTKDEATLRGVLDEDLALVAIDERAGTIVTSGTRDSFIQSITNAPAVVREQMWRAEVRVDGDLATLWAPYELWLGDRFSHCGFDSFQLVRRQDGWRIVSVAYTRSYDDCENREAPPIP